MLSNAEGKFQIDNDKELFSLAGDRKVAQCCRDPFRVEMLPAWRAGSEPGEISFVMPLGARTSDGCIVHLDLGKVLGKDQAWKSFLSYLWRTCSRGWSKLLSFVD